MTRRKFLGATLVGTTVVAGTGMGFLLRGCRRSSYDPENPIEFNVNPEMFPEEWRNPPRSVSAIGFNLDLDKEKILTTDTAIRRGLKKYPQRVLEKNLKKLYAVGSIFMYGQEYGGLNIDGTVYLPYAPSEYTEGAFHHEFAHVLFKKYGSKDKFDESWMTWSVINPSGFRYGSKFKSKSPEDVVNELRDNPYFRKNSDETREELFEQGFVNTYSQMSFQEDFAEISSALFNHGKSFLDTAVRFRRLEVKAEIATEFYGAIHPRFTRDYFAGLPECADFNAV